MEMIFTSPQNLLCISNKPLAFIPPALKSKLKKYAQSMRVFFVQNPVCDVKHPFIDAKFEEENLWVITPHLSSTSNVDKTQKKLFREFFKAFGIEKYISWNEESKRQPFTRIEHTIGSPAD